MKIHTVFITYNRLKLTKRAIESYMETVSVPFSIVIFDNCSDEEMIDWLFGYTAGFNARLDEPLLRTIFSGENKYPGYATNMGWGEAPDDATHLHRADNDFIFLPGWCEEVERMFSEYSDLGQLGMRTDEEELWNPRNVGGNCVIPRGLWDEGMRWDERPWPEIKTPGYTEDSYFSPEVLNRGWSWDRVEKPCIQSISFEDPDDAYYQASWAARGIAPPCS